jgi:hypothetical protein
MLRVDLGMGFTGSPDTTKHEGYAFNTPGIESFLPKAILIISRDVRTSVNFNIINVGLSKKNVEPVETGSLSLTGC